MGGFDHGGARPHVEEQTSQRSIRYGQYLFVIYLVLYGGFVFANAFAPSVMGRTPLAGVNLAVLWGLGLIAAAFLLALLYDWICRALASSPKDQDGR